MTLTMRITAIKMLLSKPTHDSELASVLGVTRRQATNIRNQLGAVQVRPGYWVLYADSELIELAMAINLSVRRDLGDFDYEYFDEQ